VRWLPPSLVHLAAIFGPVGYVFSVLILFQFVSVQIALGFYQSPSPVTTHLATTAPLKIVAPTKKTPVIIKPTIGIPVRMKIPSIGVNANVQSVGLTADGSMGVPTVPRDTAWYNLGPKPGEVGSAVISGHVNWLYGAKGVFEKLKSLHAGDAITVQDEKGNVTTFKVRTSHAYGLTDDVTAVFRSTDGKSHINLVTCAGVWDKKAKTYDKRLVVFADKVE
jgi:LPXTG-site transpeptidase (sortase) family protein